MHATRFNPMALLVGLAVIAGLTGCDGGETPADAGSHEEDAGEMGMDAGGEEDAGEPDAGDDDAGSEDGGPTPCEPATLAACGRTTDGIECAVSNGTDALGASTLWSDEFDDAGEWQSSATFWGTIQFPDVNGDGHDDVCGRAAAGVFCALSNGADDFGAGSLWLDAFGDAGEFEEDPSHWATLMFPDLDGDGDDDVCGRASTGLTCALSNGTDGFEAASGWDGRLNDANGWSAIENWSTLQFADLDGDGDDDYCARGVGGVVCGRSNGSSGFSSGTWITEFTSADGWVAMARRNTLALPDVNGDGNADVCARGGDGVYCALSNGSDGFGSFGRWIEAFTDASGWTDDRSYWGTIHFPDLDGDGAADVCGRDSNGLECALSNGVDGFSDTSRWLDTLSDSNGWSANEYWASMQFPDLDDDGDADLCVRGTNGLACALSNGADRFTDWMVWSTAFSDAAGWDDRTWHRTLRVIEVDPGTCGTENATYHRPWLTGGVAPRWVDPAG